MPRIPCTQMKHCSRLWQCMTPWNRIESMERFFRYVAQSLEVGHFGSLVKKNRATLRKIKELTKIRQGCIDEAARLGVSEVTLQVRTWSSL